MKILITGAHFTPAVATIEQLKKFKDVEIVYVGRKNTLEGDQALSAESQVLPKLGVRFIPITTGRLQRSFSLYTIPSLIKIPLGTIQAVLIILSEKPDVILSFGGYVAVPLVVVGWLFSIPIIIHEQTLMPGLANRISSFFADKIAVSFSNNFFKGEKVVLTGNPLRQEVLAAGDEKSADSLYKRKLPQVLVIGGNQGSHILNITIEKILDKLIKFAKIYHQTGDSKYQDYERLHKRTGNNYQVFKFIGSGWAKILSDADLVVSRAGINSLTEFAFMGKPTLAIPIPGKEQKINSQYFAGNGLGKILPQSQLSAPVLLQNIRQMLYELHNWQRSAKKLRKTIIKDAGKRLALETVILANKAEMSK